jgi:hypothetical protein
VELVGSEFTPAAPAEGESEDAPKKKGVGERLKRATQRIRGGKDGGSKGQAGGQTRGSSRQSSTPRKVGGS